MDLLFEQRVVQNPALAAETLWHAVAETYERSGKTDGIYFPLIFLVLPLAFHRRTAVNLHNRQAPAAVLRALEEDRELTLGLQRRMETLSDCTFEALSLGLSAGLFSFYANAVSQIVPCKMTAPTKHATEDVKVILAAARRVGQMFAEMSPVQVITNLRIQF